MREALFILVLLMSMSSVAAFAACNSPAGDEGAIVYNGTHKVVQFCNGNNWISAGSSTDLSSLNADNLTSGTVDPARMGTGTANATTFLRGDGSWQAVPSGADNLGNHAATQVLDMGGFNINNARQVIGGFGAMATSGTLDWNDISNARSGSGYTLLMGNASNGPGPTHYFHPFSFEYNTKNGGGNLTQLAIPYGTSSAMDQGMYIRGRYGGTWTSWRKVLSENGSGHVSIAGTLSASAFSGSGAGLTTLNAANLASGTVPTARLGSGTANSSRFLRGDGTWAAPPSGGGTLQVTVKTCSGGIGNCTVACDSGWLRTGCQSSSAGGGLDGSNGCRGGGSNTVFCARIN